MKLRSAEAAGVSVPEILDDFNERMEELGCTVDDIISVQSEAVDPPLAIHNPDGPDHQATVAVTIFYKSRE